MFLLLIIFFVAIAAIAFLEERLDRRVVNIILSLLMLAMALLVGLRPDDIDKDYSNYLSMYNRDDDLTTEISFKLIAAFVRNVFDSPKMLFLIYALLSLGVKYFVIRRMSNVYFLTLLMYFSTSYILHDFNQIRAGVATGFLLLALAELTDGSRWRFLMYALFATLFHYSAVIVFAFLLMDGKPMKTWQYVLYASVIPLCYACYFLHIDVFYMVPIPYFEEKMEAYEALQHTAEAYEVNVFNLLLLTKIAILYYLLCFAPLIEKANKYFTILFKVETLALGAFVLFTNVPIISFRINELLGVVEILLFPMVFYTIRPAWVSNAVVTTMAFSLMMIYLFYNKYLYLT